MLHHCSTVQFVTYVLPMAEQRLTDVDHPKPQAQRPDKQYERWDAVVRRPWSSRIAQGDEVLRLRLQARQPAAPHDAWPITGTHPEGCSRWKARECKQLVFQGTRPCSREGVEERRDVFAFDDFVHHFIVTYAKPNNRTWEEK